MHCKKLISNNKTFIKYHSTVIDIDDKSCLCDTIHSLLLIGNKNSKYLSVSKKMCS